jgi:uncharacterized protein (TIGR00661 family)
MARILYAINGDGLGHVFRSIPIIRELSKRHKLKIIISSKRAYAVLKKNYPSLKNIHLVNGLSLIYKSNSVDNLRTAKDFLSKMLHDSSSNFEKIYKLIKSFNPNIILSDFEHGTLYVSQLFNIPVICPCNIHTITHLKYKVPRKYLKDYLKTKIIIKFLSPNIDHHILTDFSNLPVKEDNVYVFPPIVRESIFRAKPKRKGYILIYQTSSTNHALINSLKNIDKRFIVYGFNKNLQDKNIIFKEFSDKGIVDDLKGCDACISNGGFTFITEALYLRKPVLSIPIKGQFEQIFNALQIKRLGYGEFYDNVNSAQIKKFIKKIPIYYNNLKSYNREDNSRIISKIEELISNSKAGRRASSKSIKQKK